MTIYLDRNSSGFYASKHASGTVAKFKTSSDEDLKRLTSTRSFLTFAILSQKMEFENYEIKSKLINIFL